MISTVKAAYPTVPMAVRARARPSACSCNGTYAIRKARIATETSLAHHGQRRNRLVRLRGSDTAAIWHWARHYFVRRADGHYAT